MVVSHRHLNKHSKRSFEILGVISSSQLKRTRPTAHNVSSSESDNEKSNNTISNQDVAKYVVNDKRGAKMLRGLLFEALLEEQSKGSLEDDRQMRLIFLEKNHQTRQECRRALPSFPRLG